MTQPNGLRYLGDVHLGDFKDDLPESRYHQGSRNGQLRFYHCAFLLLTALGRRLVNAVVAPLRTPDDGSSSSSSSSAAAADFVALPRARQLPAPAASSSPSAPTPGDTRASLPDDGPASAASSALEFVVTPRDPGAAPLVLRVELLRRSDRAAQPVADACLRHHYIDAKAARLSAPTQSDVEGVLVGLSFEILAKSVPVQVRVSVKGLEAFIDRAVHSPIVFVGTSAKMSHKAANAVQDAQASLSQVGVPAAPGLPNAPPASPPSQHVNLQPPDVLGDWMQESATNKKKRPSPEAGLGFVDLIIQRELKNLSDVIRYLTRQQEIDVLTEEEKLEYLGNFFRFCNSANQVAARTHQQVTVDAASGRLFEMFFCGRGISKAFQMVKEVYSLPYFHRFMPREGSMSLLHLTSNMASGARGQVLFRFSASGLVNGKLALDALRADEKTQEYNALVGFDPARGGWIIGNGLDAQGRPKVYATLTAIVEDNGTALTTPVLRRQMASDHAPHREGHELQAVPPTRQLAKFVDVCEGERIWTDAPFYTFQFEITMSDVPLTADGLQFAFEQRTALCFALVAQVGNRTRTELLVSLHEQTPSAGARIHTGTAVVAQDTRVRWPPFRAAVHCSCYIEGLTSPAQIKVDLSGSDSFVVSEPFLDHRLAKPEPPSYDLLPALEFSGVPSDLPFSGMASDLPLNHDWNDFRPGSPLFWPFDPDAMPDASDLPPLVPLTPLPMSPEGAWGSLAALSLASPANRRTSSNAVPFSGATHFGSGLPQPNQSSTGSVPSMSSCSSSSSSCGWQQQSPVKATSTVGHLAHQATLSSSLSFRSSSSPPVHIFNGQHAATPRTPSQPASPGPAYDSKPLSEANFERAPLTTGALPSALSGEPLHLRLFLPVAMSYHVLVACLHRLFSASKDDLRTVSTLAGPVSGTVRAGYVELLTANTVERCIAWLRDRPSLFVLALGQPHATIGVSVAPLNPRLLPEDPVECEITAWAPPARLSSYTCVASGAPVHVVMHATDSFDTIHLEAVVPLLEFMLKVPPGRVHLVAAHPGSTYLYFILMPSLNPGDPTPQKLARRLAKMVDMRAGDLDSIGRNIHLAVSLTPFSPANLSTATFREPTMPRGMIDWEDSTGAVYAVVKFDLSQTGDDVRHALATAMETDDLRCQVQSVEHHLPHSTLRDAVARGTGLTALTDVTVTGECIGEGNFGRVFTGHSRQHGTLALKLVRTGAEGAFLQAIMEISVHARIPHHRNVLQLIGYTVGPQGLFICTPYLNGGCLLDLLVRSRTMPLECGWTASNVVSVAHDVALGMQHIHAQGLVHCDLAARNVLLEIPPRAYGNYRAAVADFGLALRAGARPDSLPPNCAPECDRNWTASTNADVFSFGVLLWEMFTVGSDPRALRAYMPEPLATPQQPWAVSLRDLLLQCIVLDPHLRPPFPTIRDVLNNVKTQLPPIDLIPLSGYSDVPLDSRAVDTASESSSNSDIARPTGTPPSSSFPSSSNGQRTATSRPPSQPASLGKFCGYDGREFGSDEMYCVRCGRPRSALQ